MMDNENNQEVLRNLWAEGTPVTAPRGDPEPSQEELRELWNEGTPVTIFPNGRRYSGAEYRRRIHKTFSTDPLAWATEQERQQFEPLIAKSENPDDMRKRLALAAFYSGGDRSKMAYLYRHLDRAIELAANGKTTVDKEYSLISAQLRAELDREISEDRKKRAEEEAAEESTWYGELGYSILSGLVSFAGGMGSTYLKCSAWCSDLVNGALRPILPQAAYEFNKGYDRIALSGYGKRVKEAGEDISGKLQQKARMNPDFIMDMLKGDFDKVSSWDFAKALAQSAPDMGFQILLGSVAPYAVPAFIGVRETAQKAYEVEDRHPEWNGRKKWTYIGLSAANEALLDMVTAKIMGGGMTKKQGAKIVKAGLLKYLGKSFLSEGSTEALQQLDSNILDYLYEVDGPHDDWTMQEKAAYIMRGVLESGFIGAVYGAPEGAVGWKTARDIHLRAENAKTRHERRAADLRAKQELGPLTREEFTQLRRSEMVMETKTPGDTILADHLVNVLDKADSDEAIRNSEEFKREMERAPEGTSEEAVIGAIRAARQFILDENLQWDPRDTADTALELAAEFPDIKLRIVETADDIPADIRAKIDAEKLDPMRIRAWTDDDGNVWLVAGNVRPSQVARVIGHEVIGHHGLRAVFGEKFDEFLDGVYREHYMEIQKLSKVYNRDTETVENQRYLTEEFLANCANAKVKPSWWKEFIGKIRQALRKLFPNLSFTDADIEAALSRSARAMRRKGVLAQHNGGMGTRFAYTIENAVPSKDNYRVERVNENAGTEFNRASGVVCNENAVFSEADLPETGKIKWIKQRLLDYAGENGIIGLHDTPCLGGDVEVTKGSIRNDVNHLGTPIRQNMVAVIPEMLKNAVLIQTENNGGSKTHILATKVRYGGERFVVGIVVNENNGKFFYNHELTEINALTGSVSEKPDVEPAKASVINVVRKALLSSGFDGKNEKNTRFSIDDGAAQVDTEDFKRWFKQSKVVDENGDPLVVYHGSDYDPLAQPDGKGTLTPHTMFTGNPDYAKRYGQHVRSYYLSIQHPFDIRNPEDRAILKEYREGHDPSPTGSGAMDWADYDYDDFVDFLNEKYPKKYDGAILDEGADGGYGAPVKSRGLSYVIFNENQAKSATDNAGTFDPNNPDVRYSIDDGAGFVEPKPFTSGIDDSRGKNIVAMLRPIVGKTQLGLDKDQLSRNLKERYGVDVSPAEAWIWANEAVRLNRIEHTRRLNQVRDEWLYENNLLWKQAVDYAGSPDFKVRVSDRMKDRELSGTFWLRKGDEKKYTGTVIDLDALANEVARQQSRDALDVEQEFFDFFNGLDKPKLHHQYHDFRQQELAGDKAQARRDKEEWMRQEKFRIEDEVVRIIEAGQPVTLEWALENRKAYEELYRRMFDGKEAPRNVGKADLEAINAALTQAGGDASSFAEAYKAAREKAYADYMEKMRIFRDRVMQSKADAVKLQREALDFAEKNLPPELRGEFARRIVGLLELPVSPSGKYPEGRRMHEFQKLLADMTSRRNDARRDEMLPKIRQLLDRYRVSRTYKGISVSKLPAVQTEVSEIGKIFRLSPEALETYRGAQIEAMGKFDEGSPEWNEVRDRAVLSALFGDLGHRDADAADAALDYLEKLVTRGKSDLRMRLEKKLEFLQNARRQLIHNLTGGVVDTTGADAKMFRKHSLRQRARLESLLQLASGLSVKEFDQSVFGQIVRNYNLAQDRELAAMRHMDHDVREAIARIFGKEYTGVFGFAKFLREATEEIEHSGVHRKLYTAKVDGGYSLVGKRPAIRAKLNWKLAEAAFADMAGQKITYVKNTDRDAVREHLKPFGECGDDFAVFLKDGKLKVYNLNAETGEVSSFDAPPAALPRGCSYMTLNDIGINFAKHQIDDCAAGVRPVDSEFAESSADAQYQALNDDGKLAAEVELIADLPNLETQTAELEKLTRDQAMQLILTWEQDHYKDTMRWNGFDDETMKQLYDFVGDKYLAFARWMRDYEAKHADSLDKLSREKYGVPLPRIENYHPGRFEGLAGQKIKDDKAKPLGGMSMNPSFLIARRGHLKAPDVNAGAFGVFKQHMQNQTHFIELNDVVGDLRGIFNDLKVVAAINSTLGKDLSNEIQRRIGSLATSSSQDRTAASKIFGKLYRDFVPAKLALSVPSMLKQGASALNYMEKIPMAAWGKYFTRSMTNHADFRTFRKWAWQSEYMQNRFAGGMDPDLVYLANATLDSEHYDPLLGWMMDKAMIPTKLGDAFAAIYGGYTVYAHTRDQAIKNGATKLEAEKLARYAWMKATDETQQGAKLTNKNYFMENPGGQRFLTMFMTNPIQTMDLVLQSIDEVRLGRGGTEARKRLARQLFISHIVIPSAMFLITQAWRHGFDLDEWNWEEYGISCLLGSFNGALYMNLIAPIGEKILRIVEGKPILSRGGDRAVPVIDAAENAVGTFDRLRRKIARDDDLTPRDIANGVQALGDAMIAGGQFDRRLGTAGALTSAVGLRVGQVLRWFEDRKRR